MTQTNYNNLPKIEQPNLATGWEAHLYLGFTKHPERTIMKHRRHSGPLRVQRPFYPEQDGTCHVYLLHPPGGVVGGDILNIEITADHATNTLITTPAANKFYRSNQKDAHQLQTVKIENNATFEWLPQETIVFDSAYVKSKTRIELANTATFIGWDIVCLGRPASGETFSNGRFKQHIEIWRAGEALFIDRCLHEGGSSALQAHWGMASYPVTGSMFCTTNMNSTAVSNTNLVNKLRDTIKSDSNCLFSITNMNGVIICRYLGEQIEQAKSIFTDIWKLIRPAILNKQVSIPRIWNT